ncbi:unnamed protein product [Prunus armeniaca]
MPFQCIHSDVWGPSAHIVDSKGVSHHLPCPHNPQQNGLAERKNRHVIDTALTLLSAASLPTKFWVHYVSHAVYLISRMPSEVLNHQSPFLKLFGHAPNVQNLRVFVTAVYPYVRCYNVHKLQPRTTQCVFMGYAQAYEGVLCFNLLTDKFVVSRHVLHDEIVFPFANKMSSSVSGSSHGNSKTTPVLVSIPIPLSSSAPAHSMSLSQPGLQPAVSQDVILPHQVSDSDSISSASSSYDSIGDKVPLDSVSITVLRDDQLQVLLPASSQIDAVSVPSGSVNTHTMTTRSKDGSRVSCIQEVVDELSAVFEMKDMGKLTYFLGLQIDYNAESDIFVSQKKYAKDLLHKAGMSSCRSCLTPSIKMDFGGQLHDEGRGMLEKGEGFLITCIHVVRRSWWRQYNICCWWCTVHGTQLIEKKHYESGSSARLTIVNVEEELSRKLIGTSA